MSNSSMNDQDCRKQLTNLQAKLDGLIARCKGQAESCRGDRKYLREKKVGDYQFLDDIADNLYAAIEEAKK